MTHDTPRPRRARQLPSTEQLRIWRDFIETADALRSELTARLQSESSLSSGDYAVLLALSEAEGHRMRSSELAAHIDWERSRLSHHLGRMEKRGLIQRVECATDSRGAEVVLSEEGARIFRAATAPHARGIKQHFGDALTPEQFESLDDILQTLNRHLEATR